MLKQVRHLTFQQYRWVVASYLKLAWAKLFLKFASPSAVMKKIELVDWAASAQAAVEQTGTLPSETRLRCEHLHESVRLAARLHLGRTDCLPKAMVLADMLGVGSSVKIGVQKNDSRDDSARAGLASHAWVEYHGVPISEPKALQKFVPLRSSNPPKN